MDRAVCCHKSRELFLDIIGSNAALFSGKFINTDKLTAYNNQTKARVFRFWEWLLLRRISVQMIEFNCFDSIATFADLCDYTFQGICFQRVSKLAFDRKSQAFDPFSFSLVKSIHKTFPNLELFSMQQVDSDYFSLPCTNVIASPGFMNLRELRLVQCNLQLQLLLNMTQHCTLLETVEFSVRIMSPKNKPFVSEDVNMDSFIVELIKRNPNLRYISLSVHPNTNERLLGTATLLAITNHCPNLTSLGLHRYSAGFKQKIDPTGAQHMTELLRAHAHRLTKLELTHNHYVTQECCEVILAQCTQLRHCVLQHLPVKIHSTVFNDMLVKTNKKLEFLRVENNEVPVKF